MCIDGVSKLIAELNKIFLMPKVRSRRKKIALDGNKNFAPEGNTG